MPRLVTLKVYPNEPAALVAQAILRGGGVDSVLRLNTAGGMEPQLQFVGGVPLLVAEAFQTLQETRFHERAEAFAREIATYRPHLVGLQEITLIRLQSPGDRVIGGTTPAEDVFLDHLDVLMNTLAAHNVDYVVAGLVHQAPFDRSFGAAEA